MNREIKFNFIYGIDGKEKTYFNKSFTFGEIENGLHRDEISDNPLLKEYSILIKRQYTGLKDNNGKEVYEGDVCNGLYAGGNGTVYRNAIVWSNAEAGWSFANSPMWTWEEIEVIGNIHENPELLK